jgi:hypothetical protein
MTAFEPESILTAGARRAGSDLSAPPGWYAALQLLVASAQNEGGLSDAGRSAMGDKLEGLVAERLTADAMLAADPAITSRPLPVRFIVAGLARTGTTLLHRLLSCDPDVEFLPTWQAFLPVPPASGSDGRRAEVVAWVEQLRVRQPEAFRMHPIDADSPEEEVFLLQHSFASMLFALNCPLPTYNRWLTTADHAPAYEFAFDLLRLNEHVDGKPTGRPRIMKSPQFVLDLAVVASLAADALIVQTHRDPVDLVGSYCSIYANSRRRTCTTIDPLALGQERVEHLAAMADRSMAVRDAADERGDGARFIDVHYARLVAHPIETVEKLYTVAGLSLSRATRAAMVDWLEANPQGGAGVHRYDLAEYGLDRSSVEAALERYVARFAPGAES